MEAGTEARPQEAPAGEGYPVEIARPDDWHVHLRDDEMLATVAHFTAARFRYALVMPNLVPPIATAAALPPTAQRILAAVGPPRAASVPARR